MSVRFINKNTNKEINVKIVSKNTSTISLDTPIENTSMVLSNSNKTLNFNLLPSDPNYIGVQSTNKIFGSNSFETKVLGDSLYTNSNIITGGSTPFTIEFYALIKTTIPEASTYVSLVAFDEDNFANNGQGLYIHKNTLQLVFYRYTPQPFNTIGKSKIFFNEINKITMSYDGSAFRFFINDVLDFIIGTINPIIKRDYISFMRSHSPMSNGQHTGIIDNINTFDGEARIVRDYDEHADKLVVDLSFDGENGSTKIVDNGTLKYNWIVNGTAKLNTTEKFEGFSSLYLGSTGYITTNCNLSLQRNFTISFNYVRKNTVASAIIDYRTTAGAFNGFLLTHPSANSNKMNLYFNGDGTTWQVNLMTNTDIVIDKSYRIDLVCKDNTVSIYIDNVLDISQSYNTDVILSVPQSRILSIGRNVSGAGGNLLAYIKNFKIYKDVAIIPESRVGKIQLDFDNNLNDKYNNSTWTNSNVTFDQVNSVKGYATYFDSSSDYLEANVNNSYLNYASNDFNLSFDLKETSKVSNVEVFSNNIASTAAGSIYFYTGPTTSGFDYFSKPTGVTSNTQSSFVNIYYNYKVSRYKGVLLTMQNGVITTAQNVGNISFNLINGGSFRLGKPTTTFHSTIGGFIGYLDNFKSNSDHFYGKIWAMVIANVAVANSPYDYNNTSLATHKSYFPGSIAHLKYSSSTGSNIIINDVANSYIIEENPLGKKFYIYASNGTYTNTEAQLFLEFLDANNNVIVAMKWFRDTTYSNMFTYGPTLSSQINTTKVGAYGITNGILEVNNNGLLFTNLSTASTNYIGNFSYAINLNNIKKYRISGMKAVGDYNPTQPGVRIQEVIDNGYFEPIVDKPTVHFPLETNATNIGFANLTINSIGNPTYTTIDNKKCIKFESSKYLSINSNNIFNLGSSSDFYIEVDFYPTVFTSTNGIGLFGNFINSSGSVTNGSTYVEIRGTSDTTNHKKVLVYYRKDSSNVYNKYASSNEVNFNQFNNLIVKRKNNILTIILNGIEIIYQNVTIPLDFSTSNTSIGQLLNNSNTNLNGYMSNFKMFVGTSEIPETYNDKKVLDLDFKPTRKSYLFKDNNNKCIIHPVNITQRDYQNSQYCCTFNGVDQYLQLGKNDLLNFGLDDFVIEINFLPILFKNDAQVFIADGSTVSSDINRCFVCIGSTVETTIENRNKILIGVKTGTGDVYSILASSNEPILNTINKVLIVRSGNELRLKLNENEWNILTNFNYSFNFNLNNNTNIGRGGYNSSFFNGTLYSLKVLRNTIDLTLLESEEDNGGGEGEYTPITLSLNIPSVVENPVEGSYTNVSGVIRYADLLPTVTVIFNDSEVEQSNITLTSRGSSNGIEQDYDLQIKVLNDGLDGTYPITVTVDDTFDVAENSTNLTVVRDYPLTMNRADTFNTSWYQLSSTNKVTVRNYQDEQLMYFNGLSSLTANGYSWKFGLDKFTIELDFVITKSPSTNNYHILSCGKTESWYAIEITSNREIRFLNRGTVKVSTTTNAISLDTKYRLAITRDSNYNLRIFLNGVKVAEAVDNSNYTFDEDSSDLNHNVFLGKVGTLYNDNIAEKHFKGYMKNFYFNKGECLYTGDYTPTVLDKNLTTKSLLTFTNDDVGFTTKVDSFNPNITWTNSGCTVSNNQLVLGSVSNRLVSTENDLFNFTTQNWTIDIIATPSQIITEAVLFDNRLSGSSFNGILIRQSPSDPTSLTISLGISTATTSYTYNINTGVNSLVANTEFRLKVVRSLGYIAIFFNGVRKNRTAVYTNSFETSKTVCIGNNKDFNKGFNGKIKQIRILNGIATDVHAYPVIEGDILT